MAGGRLFLSYIIANHDLLDQGRLLRAAKKHIKQFGSGMRIIVSILWPRGIPSFFIPFAFFNLIHQISNFLLDLACIPLDEQDPEGEKK